MLELQGSVIRPGLLIGIARKVSPKAWVFPTASLTPDRIPGEIENLDAAVEKVRHEVQAHLEGLQDSSEDAQILNAHLEILNDPDLRDKLNAQIRNRLHSAPRAVQAAFNTIYENFAKLSNDFFAQRAADYRDIEHRLLSALAGEEGDAGLDWQPNQIAVLNDVTPSQITTFARSKIPGYCCVHGSYTSHASILTRSLNIPAVVGIADLYNSVNDGDQIVLDALEGRVVISPDQDALIFYTQLREKYLAREAESGRHTREPLATSAGKRIKLRCNIDLLSDLDLPAQLGADGIGLYRTEFLYLGKDVLPSEDLQCQIYREVAEKTAPHSVIIRSFDLGGDKLSHLIPAPEEDNPYLGCRGIRFSLARPEIFKTQIRAVLRAGVHGRIKLMFPMVSDLREFYQARRIVDECRQELQSEGIPCADSLPLGVMIEVPSAALSAADFAKACDFLSIGTNDLVQYTLAADRNNSSLGDYYIPHHPAVLKLLRATLDAAKTEGKPVSLCGEMASQPEYLPLLIGMGFTDLSVAPSSYAHCRGIIRCCDAALDDLVRSLDPAAGLAAIEELVFDRLKPYYRF